jgi:hypothetical protein
MVETTAEAPAQKLITSLLDARRTVRLMAQGIMPAYAAAIQASATLRAVSESDRERRQSLRKTGQVLGAITMGIAPSQSHCLEADQQLERLIDSLKSGQDQIWSETQASSGTPEELRQHMLILGSAGADDDNESPEPDSESPGPDRMRGMRG